MHTHAQSMSNPSVLSIPPLRWHCCLMLLSDFSRGWFARKLLASGSVSQAEMESIKSNLWKQHEEAVPLRMESHEDPTWSKTRVELTHRWYHTSTSHCLKLLPWELLGLRIILNLLTSAWEAFAAADSFKPDEETCLVLLWLSVTTFPDVSGNASNHVLVADSKGWLWSCTQKHSWKDMGNWVATKWEGFVRPTDKASSHPTGVDLELLKKIGAKLCEVPEGLDWISWRLNLLKIC